MPPKDNKAVETTPATEQKVNNIPAPTPDAPAPDTNNTPAPDANTNGLTADEIAKAQADALAKKEADRVAAIQTSIKEKEGKLKDAQAWVTMMNDPKNADMREVYSVAKPELFASRMAEPKLWEDEIAKLKLTLLPEDARNYRTKYDDLKKQLIDLEAEIATKPWANLFHGRNAAEPAKKKTTTVTSTPTSDLPTWASLNRTLLPDADVTAKVLAMNTAGKGETEMIKEIYGSDFTIAGSAPRAQIHNIRKKNGLLAGK